MSTLFPALTTPIAPVEPETPYTGLLVWLAMSPRIIGNTVDATASITYLPYRVLSDGSIDQAPETMRQTYNIGSALETIAAAPTGIGAAIQSIASVLQAVLAAG